jgi:predicted phage tail protein
MDYTFRCVIHAQQQVVEAEHIALAAQESMHAAQQKIIIAQQDANQSAIDAHQHEALSNEAICETGLYKKVISELIFKLRKSLYQSPNVLPIRI